MEENTHIQRLENRLASIERDIQAQHDKINALKHEKDRVVIAIEVAHSLEIDRPKPEQKINKPKAVPIREHVMSMFAHQAELSVQQVWDGLKDKVSAGKPTINTTLANLVKKGELAKRGIGLYCRP